MDLGIAKPHLVDVFVVVVVVVDVVGAVIVAVVVVLLLLLMLLLLLLFLLFSVRLQPRPNLPTSQTNLQSNLRLQCLLLGLQIAKLSPSPSQPIPSWGLR